MAGSKLLVYEDDDGGLRQPVRLAIEVPSLLHVW